ncbi:MAG TPA: glycosyltransferase family 2 protein [Thermoleophilaceae bacterium]
MMIAAGARGPLLERCLERLATVGSRDVAFETIVFLDGAGKDEASRLRERVRGARVEASSVELGLAGALNRARARARGEFLVSLHDDAEIEPGWLDALVAAVDDDPEAGAVGSLILRMDRRVQAAGRELLPTGVTRPAWGRSVRDLDRVHAVDQCGSASLLVRATTWDELGGADERFYPVYYVDVDLCVAILARGQRVLLAPRSVIRHHQGASTYRAFARFLHGRNREQFRAKWGEVVTTHVPASGVVARPAAGELPRQQREPDPDRQERVQLERALEVTREYAETLQARLAWREAMRDRFRGVDARIDALTRGRWKQLREPR